MIVAYHKKDKIDYLEFYRNRFARIYPLYVVGLLLYYITKYSNFSVYKGILYLSGIQSWIPGDALILNFPGWSISVEFLFYLLFPVLYNNFYSRNNKSIWVIAALIWVITQVFSNLYVNSLWYEGPHTKSHEFSHYFPLLHINEFLAGNLAGLLFVKNFREKNYDVPIILVFIAVLLSLILIPLNFHNGLMALLFIPLIVLISCNNGVLTKLFSQKPLEYLGEISYVIYIVHIPVLYIIREVLKQKNLSPDINMIFCIYIVALLIISVILYQYIEKPLRDYLKKMRIR